MSQEKNKKSSEHKAAKPMVWVRGNDGTSYICPKDAVNDTRNVKNHELTDCVDESQNPQNN